MHTTVVNIAYSYLSNNNWSYCGLWFVGADICLVSSMNNSKLLGTSVDGNYQVIVREMNGRGGLEVWRRGLTRTAIGSRSVLDDFCSYGIRGGCIFSVHVAVGHMPDIIVYDSQWRFLNSDRKHAVTRDYP